jgi:hypothetical protein
VSGPRRSGLRDWLAVRAPNVPSALAARLSGAVNEVPDARLPDGGPVSEALAATGLWLLETVTGRGDRESGVALDLLAADALVTYAVEAAAEEGRMVGPFALQILHRAMRV